MSELEIDVSKLCGWCKDAPATAAGKLCEGCAACAGNCGARYPATPLKSVDKRLYCAACEPAAKARLAAQLTEAEGARIVKAAGISAAHKTVTLERLKPGQLDVARQYLAIPTGNLILTGDSGTGKTWTAVAILRELMRRSGSRGRWLSLPWMFASVRDWMSDERASRFKLTQYVDDLLNHDYVVLDDLGAHRATDWAVETLYLILHRWEHLDKPGGLIVTTNLDLAGVSKTFGDRVASRLAQNCKLVPVVGPDLRLQRSPRSPAPGAEIA